MSLNINQKVLYVRSDDTDQAVWKELPCIQGSDGDNAYITWLKKNGLEDTPENWNTFLNVTGGRGSSRITFDASHPTNFTLYTPGPTDQGPSYSGSWTTPVSTVLPLGAKYQNTNFTATSDNPKTPIIFGSTAAYTTEGSAAVFDAACFNEDIRYRLPQGLHVGNGSNTKPNYDAGTTTNSKYEAPVEQGYFIDTFLGATSSTSVATPYKTPRTVNAITIDKQYGDLCIGGGETAGDSSTSNIPLGQTVIKAGLASYTGKKYNMGSRYNSYSTASAYNGIIARRKYNVDSSWKDYMMIDSGHTELVHVEIDVGSNGAVRLNKGNLYTCDVTLQNNYSNIPYTFINVYNWNPVDASEDWRNYFTINTIWSSPNKLQIRLYYKNSVKDKLPKKNGVVFAPHIGILVVSADTNTPFIERSFHTSSTAHFKQA